MFESVLAVMLFGMVPLQSGTPVALADAHVLEVVSPSPLVGTLSDALRDKKLTASGFTIVDLESSETLVARNADGRRPMASLTKLMTAVLIIEHHQLDEWVTVPKGVTAFHDSKVRLTPGQHFRLGDLLKAMLVSSSNEAAYTLALYHSGSQESFVTEMNDRAVTLGLTGTSFANASGLDDPKQWSTPRDIAHLAAFALHYPDLRARLSLSGSSVTSREGAVVALEQTHELLKESAPGVVAGKTGTTDEAGQCLMSVVRTGDRDYLVVLLASRQRYRDMRTLLSVLASLQS